MPDPFDIEQLPEVRREYEDPTVWCEYERGDIVRDVHRLLATSEQYAQDIVETEETLGQVYDRLRDIQDRVRDMRGQLAGVHLVLDDGGDMIPQDVRRALEAALGYSFNMPIAQMGNH